MSWTTDFGFRDVPIADKARRVGEVFTSVAFRYDLMNDLMSGGGAPHLEGLRRGPGTAQVR